MFISTIVTDFVAKTCTTPLSESPVLQGIKASMRFVGFKVGVRQAAPQVPPTDTTISCGNTQVKTISSDGMIAREYHGLPNGNSRFELTTSNAISYSDWAKATWSKNKARSA